ncbi:MAG: succinate dehydrogenase cytochrome b subunit, partial [Acidobacteriota bacterium]
TFAMINMLSHLFSSSLARKYVMAVTGIFLFVFVIVHMLGNLQIFLGPVAINEYADSLKSRPWLVWPTRIGLLAVFLVHVATAVRLALENREARPVKYSSSRPIASTYAARTIVLSGLLLLFFIVFHLAHFTFGFVDPQYLELRDMMGRPDVYRMMVTGFSQPAVSGFYLISMGLLGLHLSHGLASALQSLGLRSNRSLRTIRLLAITAATAVFVGNCSIPIAILAGVIR